MEKVASKMLDKLQQFVQENPELIKSTLLAGGAGALGGALLTGKESDHESTGSRVSRKLKNALLGALAAGGGTTLLINAGKNFGSAKLQSAPTPEDKFKQGLKDIGKGTSSFLKNPLTLTGTTGAGLAKGFKMSRDAKHTHAAELWNALRENADEMKLGNLTNSKLKDLLTGAPKLDVSKAHDLKRATRLLREHKDVIKDYVSTSNVFSNNPELRNKLLDKFHKAGVPLDISVSATQGVSATKLGKLLDKLRLGGKLGGDTQASKLLGLARRHKATAGLAAAGLAAPYGISKIVDYFSED